MPVSDIHKKKRRKNLVLLALIFAWVALIWVITMVKMAHAEESSIDEIFAEMEAEEFSDDQMVEDDLSADVVAGANDFIDDHGKFQESRKRNADEADQAEKKYMAEQIEHMKFMEAQPAIWWENWQDKTDPEKQ